jgi:hypothetical protein
MIGCHVTNILRVSFPKRSPIPITLCKKRIRKRMRRQLLHLTNPGVQVPIFPGFYTEYNQELHVIAYPSNSSRSLEPHFDASTRIGHPIYGGTMVTVPTNPDLDSYASTMSSCSYKVI